MLTEEQKKILRQHIAETHGEEMAKITMEIVNREEENVRFNMGGRARMFAILKLTNAYTFLSTQVHEQYHNIIYSALRGACSDVAQKRLRTKGDIDAEKYIEARKAEYVSSGLYDVLRVRVEDEQKKASDIFKEYERQMKGSQKFVEEIKTNITQSGRLSETAKDWYQAAVHFAETHKSLEERRTARERIQNELTDIMLVSNVLHKALRVYKDEYRFVRFSRIVEELLESMTLDEDSRKIHRASMKNMADNTLLEWFDKME